MDNMKITTSEFKFKDPDNNLTEQLLSHTHEFDLSQIVDSIADRVLERLKSKMLENCRLENGKEKLK